MHVTPTLLSSTNLLVFIHNLQPRINSFRSFIKKTRLVFATFGALANPEPLCCGWAVCCAVPGQFLYIAGRLNGADYGHFESQLFRDIAHIIIVNLAYTYTFEVYMRR